jgi:hypothetical protein
MTNRMDHTNCPHDSTPAGRRSCRNANRVQADVAAVPNSPVIRTPAGNIRAGSIIVAEVRGGYPAEYTVIQVSDNIKNEYPGWEADARWGYADQVIRVIKF